MSEYRPTFGVLLAIPALLASFVAIGETIDAGAHLFPLTYDRAASFGRCGVALAVCVYSTIVAFRWVCEAGEIDDGR